jgi:S1 RNA binding domain protein
MDKTEYEINSIVEGDITNITSFGVFVKFPNGQEGLIHISEIAYEYVTDINQYVKVGEKINVKILGKNKNNKLELSLRQTQEKKIEPSFPIKKSKNEDFEKKLNSFLKRSEEKQIDIRRNLKLKQGITKKRK